MTDPNTPQITDSSLNPGISYPTFTGLPPLEVTCPSCNGNGRGCELAVGHDPCQDCNGSGLVPTEAGKQILTLVQNNTRLIGPASIRFFNP